jgi:polysaccharide export outer membrane protein
VAGNIVFVIGQVNNPGQFPIVRPTDVMQALSIAGGLTPFGDEDDIMILRRENGRQVSLPFDYSDVKRGKNLELNIVLKSGDVVVVPD